MRRGNGSGSGLGRPWQLRGGREGEGEREGGRETKGGREGGREGGGGYGILLIYTRQMESLFHGGPSPLQQWRSNLYHKLNPSCTKYMSPMPPVEDDLINLGMRPNPNAN